MTLAYGVRHSFGVFFPPILDEFGWSRGSTAVMLSIHLFVYGSVAPFTGALSDRWRAKRMILIGALVVALATASCGFASELWHFYVIFGVFTPIGLALVGAPLINPTINNWFFKFRGIAFSLAQMGGGLSFLYAIYAESMISAFGWRKAYFVLGVTLFVILVPMLFRFYVYHPRERRLEAFGIEGGKPDLGQRPGKIEKKFNKINKNFFFINSGFNFRPTDIQAAIGLSQFKSLNNFIKIRRINRNKIIKTLTTDKRWDNQVSFVEENNNVKPSWFGLSMLLNEKFKYNKKLILNRLDKFGIENRPIISGNFLKQPALRKYNIKQKSKDFPNANYVHEYGLHVGLENKIMNRIEIEKFVNIFFKSFIF